MDFLNHREGGVVFYQVFLLSPLKCTVTHFRNLKRLREFQEIDSQDKVVEWTLNSKEENFWVWISSKYSASGLI
jgi:hypothetical protein